MYFIFIYSRRSENLSIRGGLCDGSLCFPSYFNVNSVILLIFTVVGGCFSWYVKFVINSVDIVRRSRLHSFCILPTHPSLGMK